MISPLRVLSALTAATCIAITVTTVSYAVPVTSRSADSPEPCVRGEVEGRAESSVDDGEIRYTEATKYDTARKHAQKVWQAAPLTKVKLRGDTATTVNDLEWRDYKKKDGHGGYHHQRSGVAQTDYIYLNKEYLDPPGALHKIGFQQSVAAHELGHALGLCHKGDRYFSLMWKSVSNPPVTEPTKVDKASYKKIWG